MWPLTRAAVRRISSPLKQEVRVQKRTYLTTRYLEETGGVEKALALVDEAGIKMQIQENARCEWTGSTFRWREPEGIVEKLTFPFRAKMQEIRPEEVEKALGKGPLRIRSYNLALTGSNYSGHHVFPVVKTLWYQDKPSVFRVDKDDTLFYPERRETVKKALENEGHDAIQVQRFMDIIDNVWTRAEAKGGLHLLTEQDLRETSAIEILGHVQSMEAFTSALSPHGNEPIAESPLQDRLAPPRSPFGPGGTSGVPEL